MNYGDLTTAFKRWMHRTDLDGDISLCTQNVTNKLNRRFSKAYGPLIADTDTNDILNHNGDIYLYGTLREAAILTHNAKAIDKYDSLYATAIKHMNLNYEGAEWITDPPVMTPYTEET